MVCARCGPRTAAMAKADLAERARELGTTVEQLEALEELVRKFTASLDKTPEDKRPKEKIFVAGKVDCPAPTCYGGRTLWSDGDTSPCLLCANKGLVACQDCRGSPKCDACGGTRKLQETCADCAGHKRLPCPGCEVVPLKSDACLACAGKAARDCGRCVTKSHRPRPCGACGSDGKTACLKCRGTGGEPCPRCGGCGKIRIGSSGINATNDQACDLCDRRGDNPCRGCTKGQRKCAACAGEGKLLACPNLNRVPCPCTSEGAHRRLMVYAEALAAGGMRERARTFLGIAIEKIGAGVAAPGLPAEEAARIKTRIEARIAELSAK